MQELRESTNELYENYRSARLATRGSETLSSLGAPEDSMELDKDQLLKEKENELKRMQEMIAKMQQQISQTKD